jgi:hypothetical protein
MGKSKEYKWSRQATTQICKPFWYIAHMVYKSHSTRTLSAYFYKMWSKYVHQMLGWTINEPFLNRSKAPLCLITLPNIPVLLITQSRRSIGKMGISTTRTCSCTARLFRLCWSRPEPLNSREDGSATGSFLRLLEGFETSAAPFS